MFALHQCQRWIHLSGAKRLGNPPQTSILLTVMFWGQHWYQYWC